MKILQPAISLKHDLVSSKFWIAGLKQRETETAALVPFNLKQPVNVSGKSNTGLIDGQDQSSVQEQRARAFAARSIHLKYYIKLIGSHEVV